VAGRSTGSLDRIENVATQSFEKWLSELLQESEGEIDRLLGDKTAVRFLIAWSMFETACFGGFMKAHQVESFSVRTASSPSFDVARIEDALSHFHSRYQAQTPYKNLMHKDKCERLDALLTKPHDSLTPEERLFFVTYVVYRFRNNIFHGNKGVSSWLEYRPQIQHCTRVMQYLISHSTANVQLKAA